jgi:hypothetical protein
VASVTVYSSDAIDELIEGTVVGATFTDDHLILTLKDDSTVDVGAVVTSLDVATTTNEGIVELATDAETLTGTDTTRAVTPFGAAALAASIKASQVVSGILEAATPASYPVGNSVMALTSSAWSLNSGTGTVLTTSINTTHASQTFYADGGGTLASRVWTREYHTTNGGGGWTAWSQVLLQQNLTPASFSQTTVFTSYPQGYSRLIYTTANSTSWGFSGSAGEVITYVDGTDFARQVFTKHVGGTSNKTDMWIRTANSASGWTNWRIMMAADQAGGVPTAMAWGSANMATVLANAITTLSITFPTGRFASTPTCVQVTANSGLPGTSITEVSASNVTATGMDINLYRTNATATIIWWMAIL